MKKKKKERLAVPSLNLPRLTRPVLVMNDDEIQKGFFFFLKLCTLKVQDE